MKIALVAGEESGDRLGAALMKALAVHGEPIEFVGVGGTAMAEAGLRSLFSIDETSIIGFTEILRRLPAIRRRIREAADAIVAAKPDVLVIIDSPEFTHRVAKRVRAAAPGIPIVDYVSPTVWAWRPWRARTMRSYVDRLLALLPFEPAVHARLGGPPTVYVGHPLAERIDDLRPSEQEGRRREMQPPVVLLMPGSRRGEIDRMLGIFGEAIALVRAQAGDIELVLPTLPRLEAMVRERTANWPVQPRIIVGADERFAAFRVATAALAKSGTTTLELALSGVPMVAAYKVALAEEVMARALINLPSVILPNLIIGENAVPEFLQRQCTAENLAAALIPLLSDTPQRREQIATLKRLDQIMEIGNADPARRAAESVLEIAKRGAR